MWLKIMVWSSGERGEPLEFLLRDFHFTPTGPVLRISLHRVRCKKQLMINYVLIYILLQKRSL
jgi:hypothetical protein